MQSDQLDAKEILSIFDATWDRDAMQACVSDLSVLGQLLRRFTTFLTYQIRGCPSLCLSQCEFVVSYTASRGVEETLTANIEPLLLNLKPTICISITQLSGSRRDQGSSPPFPRSAVAFVTFFKYAIVGPFDR